MCSLDQTPLHHGIIRYSIPDLSLTADERAFYGLPASKEVFEEDLPLHDARTSSAITPGPAGLDVQGFAYVKHTSAFSADELFQDRTLEDKYFPEVCNLVRDVTGASKVVVLNGIFRRKPVDQTQDPKFVHLRGSEHEKATSRLPRNVPEVVGKELSKSREPLRVAHIDFTLRSLQQTARYRMQETYDAAKEAIEAEDARLNGERDVRVPRYAAYSVWRPLHTVKRDPLAVLDARTLKDEETCVVDFRARGGITDYLATAQTLLPPQDASKHRWYFMPEQTPDDVLIIKLADIAAEENPAIANGCGHCAPEIEGMEGFEPRESVECRVLAVWD